jgi:hypothetical protein
MELQPEANLEGSCEHYARALPIPKLARLMMSAHVFNTRP